VDFQITKIILWPKNSQHKVRTVAFERGCINVISGLSRTGKSAIIPIIDYCLGSRRCTIPTGVIREKTSWFGVVVSTSEGEKLFARREPEQQQATDDMYVQEATRVVVPEFVTKNSTRDSVKQRLDALSMLTTLSFTVMTPTAMAWAGPVSGISQRSISSLKTSWPTQTCCSTRPIRLSTAPSCGAYCLTY